MISRSLRLLAYGVISVILWLYLSALHISDSNVGLLITLTLLGDTAISLYLTTRADRLGRRRMLLIGAALMLLAGVVFAFTGNFFLLLFAATVGVISPSGNEVGPFLSIEQAALSHVIPDSRRTILFAWYTLAGSLATALGALLAGAAAQAMQHAGLSDIQSYRYLILLYAAIGLALGVLALMLSPNVEVNKPGDEVPRIPAGSVSVPPPLPPGEGRGEGSPAPASPPSPNSQPPTPNSSPSFLGLHSSRSTVLKLAALFSLDSFGGGFVLQAFAAYWFKTRFNVDLAQLGMIFFGANVLAGLSALLAARVAARFGLINTMVFTHLPSNILLILVPLMPNATLAVTMLLLRFSISQMDVPTRQSYTMAVVKPSERSAAAGITGVARTTGAAISPYLASLCITAGWLSLPFYAAGGLKIIYDLLLYRSFKKHPPPEEVKPK